MKKIFITKQLEDVRQSSFLKKEESDSKVCSVIPSPDSFPGRRNLTSNLKTRDCFSRQRSGGIAMTLKELSGKPRSLFFKSGNVSVCRSPVFPAEAGSLRGRSEGGPALRSTAFWGEGGFSMTELMVALVIIGVLVLLALPRLMPVVTKAKTTEAKLSLKQVLMLEKAHKFEYDKFSSDLIEIGFEQEKLITEGGTARYKVEIKSADLQSFLAAATAVVDFDDDGTFNVWEVDQNGIIKETVQD